MSRPRLGLLIVLLVPLSAAAEPPATDSHGDPLPKFARARFGSTRFQHGRVITSACYLPGAKTIASHGRDNVIRVWDRTTGRELRHFEMPQRGLASGDGSVTIFFSRETAAEIHDLATGAAPRRLDGLPSTEIWTAAALSSDGKVLAVAVPGRIRLWEIATGKERPAIPIDGAKEKQAAYRPTTLVLSADGKTAATVASGDETPRLRLWDTATGKELPAPAKQTCPFASVLFTPDGKSLIAQDVVEGDLADHIIGVWDVATGKQRHAMGKIGCGASWVMVSPDSKYLTAVLFDSGVWIWDLTTGKALTPPTAGANGGVVAAIAFSPDSKTLAVAAIDDTLSMTLWDIAAAREIRPLKVAPGDIYRELPPSGDWPLGPPLCFTPDGKELLFGFGSTLLRWDPATGKELRPVVSAPRDAISALAVSPDGKRLVACYNDQSMRQWDTGTGKELAPIPSPARNLNCFPCTVAYTPDGKTLAIGWSEGVIQLWDVNADKERSKLTRAHGGAIVSLAFAPDGKILASADVVGEVLLWDTAKGQLLRRLVEPPAPLNQNMAPVRTVSGSPRVAFSADGKMVAALSPDTDHYRVRLWELATQEIRHTFVVNHRPDLGGANLLVGKSDPTVLAFSPDGRSLLYAARTTVRVRDLLADKQRLDLDRADDWLEQAIFSPDGRWIAGATHQGAVRLWDAATGTLYTRINGHRGPATCLAFASDSKNLFTGGADTCLLNWDVAAALADSSVTKEAAAAWNDLASPDANKAFRAIRRLAASPTDSVRLLSLQLAPTPGVEAARIAKLVANIESDQFAVRQKATAALEKLGELAEPAVRKRLAENPPLDVTQRLEKVLQKIEGPVTDPDRLRELRAVEVLEMFGTREATAVLKKLATGAPGARLTREAAAALDRLSKRE